jgi:ProP effector
MPHPTEGTSMKRQELHPRTAVLNKTQKNKSRKARMEALQWLVKKFPQVFDNTLTIRPLKIGIIDDILLHADEAIAEGLSRSKLREAVVLFTRRIDYLACLKAREVRVDLDGNPTEEVTESEAEKAATKIKKRVEKSARNARKALLGKTPEHYGVRPKNCNPQEVADISPHYFERPPVFSTHNSMAPATKSATDVVVKHKVVRNYDPDAVARLKEKLGISRKSEALQE